MHNTPIAMIIDNNGIMPLAAAVKSISSSSKSNVSIKVVGAGLHAANTSLIYSAQEPNVSIQYIDASEYLTKINPYAGTHTYVSNAALLKFFLPEILSSYSKILYLDADILVRRDLTELLNVNVDDVYAAAVENLVRPNNNSADIIHKRGFFNSGVMLLNCEKMRNEGICAKLLETKKKLENDMFMDQTVFNIVLGNKIKLLPLRYNYLPLFDLHKLQKLNRYYGTEYGSDKELCDDVAILHLAGKCKPWIYENGYYSKKWMEIFLSSKIASCIGNIELVEYKKSRKNSIISLERWQEMKMLRIGTRLFAIAFHDGIKRRVKIAFANDPVLESFIRTID